MPVRYHISPDLSIAYVKAWGKVVVEEILLEGSRMLAENAWRNGFGILCDYREVTEFNLSLDDVKKIVSQDRGHESLFDQSMCAIVAQKDLVFGLSRMWELLSQESGLEKRIFRSLEEALKWLGTEDGAFRAPDFVERPVEEPEP